MPIYLLVSLLVSILPSSVMGSFGNHQISLAEYAHNLAVGENINPQKFLALINCESSWRIDARGDYRSEEDRYMARGLLQFWRGTFDTYAEKWGLIGEYENPMSQILLASVIIGREKNGWKHWTNCMKSIKWNGQ